MLNIASSHPVVVECTIVVFILEVKTKWRHVWILHVEINTFVVDE